MNTRNRATIAVAPLAILASMMSVTAAHADDPGKKLILSVYLDAAGGDSALAGNFIDTIKQVTTRAGNYDRDTLAGSTNLCVAYTMTRQWDSAQSTCDGAVARARVSGADDVFDFGASHKRKLALAYSNRAVMNWLHDQPEQAVTDVKRAHSLAPKTDFVAQNWSVLNAKPDNASGPAIAAVQR